MNSYLRNSSSHPEDLDNYNKASTHIRSLIQDKLDSINFKKTKHRTRRAFFKDIGATIKLLTGNLDENDGERINKILTHLESNQGLLQKQIQLQYSLNEEVIKNFNKTIQNILHNERALNMRVIQLLAITQETLDIPQTLFAKDIYNQMIILYNSILSVLQDIENSLTFCKLKTLHPSIITPTELFNELDKISSYYSQELPFELIHEKIFEFEKLIEVDCYIEKSKIIYLLSLPINFNIEYDLYYLLPIPTYIESTYATIIPKTRYLLKSKDSIKPLLERCPNKPYQCPSHFLSNADTKCESQILFRKVPSDCELIKLEINENKIELLRDINQFLITFITKDSLTFNCDQDVEEENIKGIYLLDSEPCKVSYKNNDLTFKHFSYGKPLILKDLNLKISNFRQSNVRINVKSLNLENTPVNSISTEHLDYEPIFLFYLGLLLSIICTVIFLILLCYISFKNKAFLEQNIPFFSKGINQSPNEEAPLDQSKGLYPNINLPGEAKL